MKKVLIIGYGTVGHNLAAELSALQPDIYDKYKPDENTARTGSGMTWPSSASILPMSPASVSATPRGGERYPGERC